MRYSSANRSVLVCAVLLVLPGGCSTVGDATGSDTGDATGADPQLAHAPIPPDELAASVVGASFEGTLCPPDSAMVLISEDHEAVSVNFSTFVRGEDSPVTMGCAITIDIDVPRGHQLGFPRLTWHADGAATTLVRTYQFEGAAASVAFTSEAGPDMEIADRTELWPSCRRGSRRVRLVAKLEATIHEPAGLLELIDLQIDTSWRAGTDWRAGCGPRGVLVTATPGASGDWCAGSRARACQAGLRCELRQHVESDPRLEGTCVDPNSVVTARGLAESCGGFRHIPCGDGLVCWARSRATLDHGWLGTCFHEGPGGPGTPCGTGLPTLSCDGDNRIHCDLSDHVCKLATGERFSPCGVGLPACLTGLVCSGPEGGTCVKEPVPSGHVSSPE